MAAPIDLTNAEHYAHRYVESDDTFRFVALSRGELPSMPFLTDACLGERPVLGELPAAKVLADCGKGNPRLLFHSAFCGSTLLTRALDRAGMATGLSEPVTLNDVVGFRRRGARPAAVARTADAALRLLARPYGAGEAVVIKPSNVVNPLAELLLALTGDNPALFLYAPLETFLISVARKGLECRLWVRELLDGYLQEGFVGLGFTPQDLFRQSDLQIAAVGWLAQHAHFARLADKLGPVRLRTLDADQVTADPAGAISAVARHYSLALGEEDLAAIVSGPAFTRHSKSGESYSPQSRAEDYDRARSAYGGEIDMVMEWARRVADNAGIAMDAPNQVLQA